MDNNDKNKNVQIYQSTKGVQQPLTKVGQVKDVDPKDIKVKLLKQHTFNTKVTLDGKEPQIILTDLAYNKHACICSIAEARTSDEVSWFGSVKREGHLFIIEDLYLIEQQVHSSETETTIKGLEDLYQELIQRENGFDLVNSLMYWGHYHTFNSFNPSGQDEKEFDYFKGSKYPFFIRGIACRGGTIKFDICLIESGLTYIDVPWMQASNLDRTLLEQLNSEFTEKIKPVRYTYAQGYYGRWPYHNYPGCGNYNKSGDNVHDYRGPHQQSIGFQNNSAASNPAPAGRGTYPRNTKKVTIIPDEVEMTEEEFWGQFNYPLD
jgi:hypothetical protein